jgi:Flp pilus assembly protein TadD
MRFALLALLLLLAGPASAEDTTAYTEVTITNTAGEEVIRLVHSDGREQLLDSAGNPMFDGAGNAVFPPTPQEIARQSFEEAVALKNGATGQPDLIGAAAKLKTATQNEPDLFVAWFDLGLVQLELNLLKEAQQALKKASDLQPDNVSVWLAQGIAYERDGMVSAADSAYATGLTKEPEDVALLNGAARILRKRGNFRAAADKARAILQVNSNSLDAYNTLGLAYLGLEEFELARFVFMKAQASVPGGDTSASVAANLGLVFFREGEEFQAEAKFQTARDLDPKHPGAMVNLAHVKLKNLDYPGALELLEQAHRVLPASLPIQLNLAVARRGTGDVPGAQKLLEDIAASETEYVDEALLNLGILQGDFLKDYAAAIDTYNEYIAVRERNADPVGDDDAIHDYIKEVTKLKRKEDKRQQKAAKKAAEAAAKAAEPAPAEPEPAPAEPEPAPAEPEPAPEEEAPAPAEETPAPAEEGGTPQ